MSKYLSLSCFFNYLAVGMGKWAKEDPQESFAEEGDASTLLTCTHFSIKNLWNIFLITLTLS